MVDAKCDTDRPCVSVCIWPGVYAHARTSYNLSRPFACCFLLRRSFDSLPRPVLRHPIRLCLVVAAVLLFGRVPSMNRCVLVPECNTYAHTHTEHTGQPGPRSFTGVCVCVCPCASWFQAIHGVHGLYVCTTCSIFIKLITLIHIQPNVI